MFPLPLRQLCITLACLGSSFTVASAQDDAERTPNESAWYLGYDGFRMLLEERGLTVRSDLDSITQRPRETIVVCLGDLSGISLSEWRTLRRFVIAGGALLIASEQTGYIPGIGRILAGPVATRQESAIYHQYPDCLRITDLNSNHLLTRDLRNLVLNQTGWLAPSSGSGLTWETVARLPPGCDPPSANRQPVVAVGSDPNSPDGLIILTADQSLFSDGMLWHGDNSVFAIRVTEQLTQNRRRWLIALNNGVPLPSYLAELRAKEEARTPAVPPQLPENLPLPEPRLKTMLRFANAAIDEVQQSNLLNESLRDHPRRMGPVAWSLTLLVLLLILFAIWIVWKLAQKSSQLFPLRQTRFMQSMYGVVSAKQVAASDFSSAVETLARDVCRDISGSQDPADWGRITQSGPLPPRLSRASRTLLPELVQFATHGCRVQISLRKFRNIGRAVQEIRQLLAALPTHSTTGTTV
jgi:hypothetical protein